MRRRPNRFQSLVRARFVTTFVLVLLAGVLLWGCWVNQDELWSSDRLPLTSPTSLVPTRADIAYGPLQEQRLDLYLPETAPRGVIVWLHAGGWCCGDKSDVDPLILSTIEKGFAVASANYRLVPSVSAEQQMSDVDRAIRFVKATRESWGVGADHVVVAGGSAGGNLALLAAGAPGYFAGSELGSLTGVDPRVDAVISLVGPSDLRWYVDGSIGGWGPPLVEGFLGCSNRDPDPSSTVLIADREDSLSTAALLELEPTIALDDVPPAMVPLPRCDAGRVLTFSPVFWAALTVFLGGPQLPPAYLAYGDLDDLVPAPSQGVVLHDWWAEGGDWLATYYDNPPNGGHNLSFEVNASAFYLWLGLFAGA